jgi:hypothetical protein
MMSFAYAAKATAGENAPSKRFSKEFLTEAIALANLFAVMF